MFIMLGSRGMRVGIRNERNRDRDNDNENGNGSMARTVINLFGLCADDSWHTWKDRDLKGSEYGADDGAWRFMVFF